MLNILKQTQLIRLQFVCLCISAFTAETKLMCVDLTSYIVVCNKKLKSKIYVHRPDISKPTAQEQSK